MKLTRLCHASRVSRGSGFTMIEIAISLAVIGFALVAIIGILPIGMNVQKNNREETIIHQDATLFLDAIRNGAKGLDDLTNYVTAITNAWTEYDTAVVPFRRVNSDVFWYTPNDSYPNTPSHLPITNGFRIIGLLSNPKYIPLPNNRLLSNYVNATVRAISGAAYDKFPQTNAGSLDMALKYRLTSEVINHGSPVPFTTNNNSWDPNWVDYGRYPTNSAEYYARASYALYIQSVSRHLHDLRLIFRWPILPDGSVSRKGGRQVFRTTIGGDLGRTNDPVYPLVSNLWFFRSTAYSTPIAAVTTNTP
jgi:type II secretory pathway pseudopilin PulG